MRIASFTILLLCFASIAFSQAPVVFVNSGSRAPYGTNQELTIWANGQCRYYNKEVNGPVKDSSVFSISTATLDSLFTKAEQLGFFQLNHGYTNTKVVDGSGIYISMNYKGRKKRVDTRNTDVPAVTELVKWLNERLLAKGIAIKYVQPK